MKPIKGQRVARLDNATELRHKKDYLQQVLAYREPGSGRVTAPQIRETHTSLVFLTGSYAYKMRKPVSLPFADYRTLDARRVNVLQELRLNTQLAPGIYLRAVPLWEDAGGQYYLGGNHSPGSVLLKAGLADWLLQMKRLPDESMLDHALVDGTLDLQRLASALSLLVDFYRAASPARWTAQYYHHHLRQKIRAASHSISCNTEVTVPLLNHLTTRLEALLESLEGECRRRIQMRRVVDAHGDLRPEHICLTDPPVIIDRLDTAARMRLMDPLEELTLLGVECARFGRADVAAQGLLDYRRASGDEFSGPLVQLFRGINALQRAQFSAWHLDDPLVADKQKWRDRLQQYLLLADHAAAYN